MRGLIAVTVAAALIAGCDGGVKETSVPRSEQAADGAGTASASASASVSGGAKSVAESNDVWDFKYSYPAQAGRIAPLRAMLDSRQQKALADLKKEAIDGRAAADEAGFPFHAYALMVEWKTVTDLPDWLSLSSQIYSFSGGAHGNTGFDALLWDKRTGKPAEPMALFVSTDALQAAATDAFCAALNKQREAKRGEPVDPKKDDWANTCPKISETTVILGSSNSRTFDRVGFLIDPYTAGPYAEGTYEVTLPVTKAILAAVKPEYAQSFTATR
jgi:hypothetical protein